MEKRGVSDVITTVLIILLVLAAVAIIGGIILKNLGDATEKIEAGFNTVSFDVKGVKVNKDIGLVSFNLVRNAGQGNVKGYNVVIEDSTGQRFVQKITQPIAELETKAVDVWYNKTILKDVAKVSASPIIGTSTGKEYFSEISSSYKVSGSEPIATPSGLVGYWKFDEGSGTTAKDSSGNGLDGTINGNLNWLDSNSCKVGKCFNFLSGNWMDILKSQSTLNEWSVVAWVKSPSSTPKGYQLLFSFNDKETLPRVQLSNGISGTSSNPLIYLNWNPGLSYYSYASVNNDVRNNNWRHITFVFKEDSVSPILRIYLDGTDISGSVSRAGTATQTAFSGNWRVGSSLSDYNLNGAIDELMVYNRALTPEEAIAITKI
ncbi:LamG domain-containing protein [Candidatus Pacearchaeota archaeon]|nr:LamG domain-containing protein [Candidatus Pacearchaeota archaeon]